MSQAEILNKNLLNLNAASAMLEISPATLRNWLKSGLVSAQKTTKGFAFSKEDIKLIKSDIKSGKISKLRKRANKNSNTETHDHNELLQNADNLPLIQKLFDLPRASSAQLLAALYICALEDLGLARLNGEEVFSNNTKIIEELFLWNIDFKQAKFQSLYKHAKSSGIDFSDNVLGFTHQSLSQIGQKQKDGAYYTPMSLVKSVIEQTVDKDGLFIDPCCGAGNFVLAALERLQVLGVNKAYDKVFGIDNDEVAVWVARANLTLVSKGKANSVKHIVHADSLITGNPFGKTFDFMATNPPWGASFTSAYENGLKEKYPEIISGESFSYFFVAGLSYLRNQAKLNFVLPESILNVKIHRDIREYLFGMAKPLEISYAKEKFSGVFTKAVTFLIQKSDATNSDEVLLGEYKQSISEILSDSDLILSLNRDAQSASILKTIEKGSRVYLKNNSNWALGIVTGDNARFLSKKKSKKFEEIYKGSDVYRFALNGASNFINYKRDELQQVASDELYRAKEKLVYRFICKELVFAIDRNSSLTLNSANILIPKVPSHNIESICGILNSKLAQFYYQKTFNTIKTLRGNLEKMPLPVLTASQLKKMTTLVRKLEKKLTAKGLDELNELVFDLYGISKKQRDVITAIPSSSSFEIHA